MLLTIPFVIFQKSAWGRGGGWQQQKRQQSIDVVPESIWCHDCFFLFFLFHFIFCFYLVMFSFFWFSWWYFYFAEVNYILIHSPISFSLQYANVYIIQLFPIPTYLKNFPRKTRQVINNLFKKSCAIYFYLLQIWKYVCLTNKWIEVWWYFIYCFHFSLFSWTFQIKCFYYFTY